MMLVGKALLERNDEPSDDDVRWAISGNLCRCTGYMNIVKAIQAAGREIRGANAAEPAEAESPAVSAPATSGVGA
jgi:carbon-monoxide dehydrogenase small subunit